MPITQQQTSKGQVTIQSPQLENLKAPRDGETTNVMHKFDGAWLPSVDAALIGVQNYKELTNMRYNEGGMEGINGCTKRNNTALQTYTNIKNGSFFRTNRTSDEYIVLQAEDGSNNGRVVYAKNSPGTTGEFRIDYDGTTHTDAVDAGAADSELLTGGDWGVTRATIAKSLTVNDPEGWLDANKLIQDATAGNSHFVYYNDVDMVAAQSQVFSVYAKAAENDWIKLELIKDGDTDEFHDYFDLTNGVLGTSGVTGGATFTSSTIEDAGNGWYRCTIVGKVPHTETIARVYIAEDDEDVTIDGDGSSGVYVWQASYTENDTTTNTFINRLVNTDNSIGLAGRFSEGPGGSMFYCNGEDTVIFNGEEGPVGSVFSTEDASETDPVDITEIVTNSLTDAANLHTVDSADRDYLVIMTTRPTKGFKFYVDTAPGGAATFGSSGTYWDGDSFAGCSNIEDDTLNVAADTSLTQTAYIRFDSTASTAKPMHFEERYLYAYRFVISAQNAKISQITALYPSDQAPSNIWDGVYRQPIQAQFFNSSNDSYEDYTLHVAESSSMQVPVGMILDAMTATDYIYLMFEEQMAGIRLVMLGSLVNVAAQKIAAATDFTYWNGTAWTVVNLDSDGTLDDGLDSSFAKSGLLEWISPSDEEKTTVFGSTGYVYRIQVDGTLTGIEAGDTEDIVVDLIYGVPSRKSIEVYKFPVQYKNKIMLCNYAAGNEGNRVDFCADNAPDVFNGADSSDDGYQSLYVGGIEELTCGTQLYNRFGSNIFATLVLFKNNELYLVTGDGPLDYRIFPISFTIGCPAPLTLSTAEIGFKLSEDVSRNVAMWISHSGPIMFDGAVLGPVRGLEKYFDPNESESVNFDALSKAHGWFDSTYQEWNVLLPTGTSITNNLWVVFDIARKKWYRKDTGAGPDLLTGWNCRATNGDQYIYAGNSTGYVYQLENGTSWAGSNIVNVIQTGDFFPGESNMWDITRIRRTKLVVKRVTESGASVEFYYIANTNEQTGVGVIFIDLIASQVVSADVSSHIVFQDVDSDWYGGGSGTDGVVFANPSVSTFDISVTSGLKRLIRSTSNINETGWAHGLRWTFSSSATAKGLQPAAHGFQWEWARTDEN